MYLILGLEGSPCCGIICFKRRSWICINDDRKRQKSKECGEGKPQRMLLGQVGGVVLTTDWKRAGLSCRLEEGETG